MDFSKSDGVGFRKREIHRMAFDGQSEVRQCLKAWAVPMPKNRDSTFGLYTQLDSVELKTSCLMMSGTKMVSSDGAPLNRRHPTAVKQYGVHLRCAKEIKMTRRGNTDAISVLRLVSDIGFVAIAVTCYFLPLFDLPCL